MNLSTNNTTTSIAKTSNRFGFGCSTKSSNPDSEPHTYGDEE